MATRHDLTREEITFLSVVRALSPRWCLNLLVLLHMFVRQLWANPRNADAEPALDG